MTAITGMSASTGQTLDGIGHLRQSIRDILTTPLGSRVMRRDYGSALPDLVDANLTGLTLAQLYAATAEALHLWEPRLRVTRIQAEALPADLEQGRVEIIVDAEYLPDGREIRIDGVIL
ncbi:MAG: GPW/gp25 family protein [Paracoccus sp. (in: a-proteobacteria)]|nr:GPW/gp25 family protein [Paracoccus sp. (in: a-proteobacteria)]